MAGKCSPALLAAQKRYRAQPVIRVLRSVAAKAKYAALTPAEKQARRVVQDAWRAAHPGAAARYVAIRREKRHAAAKLLRSMNQAALYPAKRGY